MKPDLYSKLVFTTIAICLVVMTLKSFPFISQAKADDAPTKLLAGTHCTGTLTANSYGPNSPNVGGYNIDVQCG